MNKQQDQPPEDAEQEHCGQHEPPIDELCAALHVADHEDERHYDDQHDEASGDCDGDDYRCGELRILVVGGGCAGC
jgi:hypothetical protein